MVQKLDPVVKERTRIKLRSVLLVSTFVVSFLCALVAAYVNFTSSTATAVACPWNGQISGNVTLTSDLSVAVGGGTTGGTCLRVTSSTNPGTTPITIDCNGYSITTVKKGAPGNIDNGDALYVDNRPNVTIKNCSTNGGIDYYGGLADNGVLDSVTGTGVSIWGDADNAVIINSKLAGITSEGKATTIANNQIIGDGQHPLYLTNPGHYNGCPYQGTNPNPVPERVGYTTYNHVITNNIIINTNPSNINLTTNDPTGSTAMYIVCSGNNYIANNVIATEGVGTAMFMRDSANGNLVEYNTIRADSAPRAAMFWGDGGSASAGVPPLTEPKDNTFRYNTFQGNTSRGFENRVSDGNNRFEYNFFLSNNAIGDRFRLGAGFTDYFKNNTFYNVATGAGNALFSTSATSKFDVKNNIFSHAGTSVSPYSWESPYGSTRTTETTELVADVNLYNNRTTTNNFVWYLNGINRSGALSLWQTARTSNGAGQGVGERVGTPGFTNVASNDFRITSAIGGQDIGALLASNATCVENWDCTNWSNQCIYNGVQLRACRDLNNCRTWNSKPVTSQSCLVTSACNPSWSCTAYSACTNGTQTRTCTDANSCGTTDGQPALSQSCSSVDSTAPTVAITAPTNNATASGTVTVTATASDTVGVAGVQFKIDGQNLSTEDTTAPYSVSWTTTTATNSAHSITAVARDAAGNNATAPSIAVSVNNVVACVESWSCGNWSTCLNDTQTRTCTDANNCGTSATRPALSQSCTTSTISSLPLSCIKEAPTCYNCKYGIVKYNRILAPNGGKLPNGSICGTTAAAPLQCDGTNAIQNLKLNKSALVAGEPLTVAIDYACYKDATYNSDDLTLWFFNGVDWKPLKTWYADNGTLPGCKSTAPSGNGYPKGGSVSFTFTPDRTGTDSYVRAFLDSSSTGSSLTTACPASLTWGNIDDMKFTVKARQSVDIDPTFEPL